MVDKDSVDITHKDIMRRFTIGVLVQALVFVFFAGGIYTSWGDAINKGELKDSEQDKRLDDQREVDHELKETLAGIQVELKYLNETRASDIRAREELIQTMRDFRKHLNSN